MNEYLMNDMKGANNPSWDIIIILSIIAMVIIVVSAFLIHEGRRNKLYSDDLIPCFTPDEEAGFKVIDTLYGKDRTHCIPCAKADDIYEKRVCGMRGKTK